MGNREWGIQLKDAATGQSIISAGGKVFVAKAGNSLKQTLFTATGASLANPITPNQGFINFWVADTVTSVDLYILSPGGQFVVAKGLVSPGPNEINVNTGGRHQAFVIPWSAVTDSAPTVEQVTGFVIPATAAVLPYAFVQVTAIDATETLDVGTLASDAGDANGFLATVPVGVLGSIKGTQATAGKTLGALLIMQDSANAGDSTGEPDVSMAGKQITYTTTAGSDTGKGFIHLPYYLLG